MVAVGSSWNNGETDILAAEKEAPNQFHRFNTLGSITQLPSKTWIFRTITITKIHKRVLLVQNIWQSKMHTIVDLEAPAL